MALDQIDVDKMEEQKEKEMSFMEHLEELRWHLVRSVLSIFVFGTVVFLAKDFVFNSVLFAPRYESFFKQLNKFYQKNTKLAGTVLDGESNPVRSVAAAKSIDDIVESAVEPKIKIATTLD